MKTLPKILASFGLALTASCGLIDSNIADFDLSLPEKEIVIDTSQWQLPSDENIPAIDCSANAGVCSLGISQLCGAEGICFGTCSESDTCDVTVLVNLWHSFDLAKEKPELEQIEGKPLVSISIGKIAFRVNENTMNVDSPEMTIYVAPAGVMSPGDPQAKAIGTIDPIPAGQEIPEHDVNLTPQGEGILAQFMKEYATPFNIIVGATLDLKAGDVVPTGQLKAVVVVTAVAGI